MRIVVLDEIPEDAELRSAWNGLVLTANCPEVFYTFEWSMAVQRAYHATLHPLVFLAFDDTGSLCGLVPLATDPGGSCASFLCATTGDYCDFVSLPHHKVDFVAAVLAELRKRLIVNVTLTNLPADSSTLSALRRAAAKNDYHCFARTAYVCAQVSLQKLERKPGENKPVLPGKKNLRRALSAMGQEGPVRLDHARSWDAAAAILPQFVLAHVARFLATGRISNLARPERRVFLEQLAKLLSEAGWLTLTRMMSGNKPLAWNYGFQFRHTWFWYQPTFDNDWERHSPGFCLLAKVIEEAADNPALTVVDLGLGEEEYKDRFANSGRETMYVTLHASIAHHVREIVRYRAAEIIKRSARLEASTRRVVDRLRQLRESVRRDGLSSMLLRTGKRLAKFLWSEDEVLFFEWTGSDALDSSGLSVEPLDWSRLASAALQYVDDKATVAYLLRSASLLREKKSEGFGCANSNGVFVSIVWVSDFEAAFYKQMSAKIKAPSADSMLLFDCWPLAAACSENAAYQQAIAGVAERMREKGKKTWVFALANNSELVQHLAKAGFQRRYSLVRCRFCGWQRIVGETPDYDELRSAEVAHNA